MMFKEIEHIPLNNYAKAKRKKLTYNVGTNDAEYMVKTKVNGQQQDCPFYILWVSMLRRAYSPIFHIRQPSYKTVIVCDEWLLFSNFKKWVIEQGDIGNKHLDKDLLSTKKVYSPITCLFIPRKLNNLIQRGSKGYSYDKRVKKYAVKIWIDGKQQSLGYFNLEKDARRVYVTAKEIEVEKYIKQEVDERIIKALRRFIKEIQRV